MSDRRYRLKGLQTGEVAVYDDQGQSVTLTREGIVVDGAETSTLPVYSVAGQVSHIPTTPELAELKQVLCYDGYLTPQNPANQHHCIGASYHPDEISTHCQ